MGLAQINAPPGRPSAQPPVRAMVVDDSAVIRGIIARTLENSGAIKVVATAANGADAVRMIDRFDVDVLILDIEMPVLDGLAALPKILAVAPDVKIIMASSLTLRGAEVSLEALRRGATDYIPKPSVSALHGAEEFKQELVRKVLGLGMARARRSKPATAESRERPVAAAAPTSNAPITLRKPSIMRPSIIGIGASTGGPQALTTLFTSLPANITLPIVIVQHMPPLFTRQLAEQIGRVSRRPCQEGSDGCAIERGKIYVAPGGHHMSVERHDGRSILRITDGPPENFCRPAVDPLFRSLAAAYGNATLAVVLTGMGSDGAHGAEAIAAAGGTILAQDEASSVVWGMPGAAAHAGVCSALIPLKDFGRRIGEFVAP
jgi:two-component system, chemotaxis family, protein-glutamate methylesterase/glutaminase